MTASLHEITGAGEVDDDLFDQLLDPSTCLDAHSSIADNVLRTANAFLDTNGGNIPPQSGVFAFNSDFVPLAGPVTNESLPDHT